MLKYKSIAVFIFIMVNCSGHRRANIKIVSARVQVIQRKYIDPVGTRIYMPSGMGGIMFGRNFGAGSLHTEVFLQRDFQQEVKVKIWPFRNKMAAYFRDYKALSDSISSGKLKFNDLSRIVGSYNHWYDTRRDSVNRK